jgi:hypothetical protein
MRQWVFVLISLSVVAAAAIGFVVFFLYSPLDADVCKEGSALLAPLVSAFQRDNILGVSLPMLIGSSLCVFSVWPTFVYKCAKDEGYIDLYYLMSLLHSVPMVASLVCFAYAVAVMDRLAIVNVYSVLDSKFKCTGDMLPMSLSDFEMVHTLGKIALYTLSIGTVIGHSGLVVSDETKHPWNNDENTTLEKRMKSIGAPLSMACSGLATLVFAYLSYDMRAVLPFDAECGDTSGVYANNMFWYTIICTFGAAVSFSLTGAAHALRWQLRAGELADTTVHQQTLRSYVTINIVFAVVLIICGVSLLHAVFVYDWVAVVALDGHLDEKSRDGCVPQFNLLTHILVAVAVGLYMLAVLFPHFGWLTQKARPDKYQALVSEDEQAVNLVQDQ